MTVAPPLLLEKESPAILGADIMLVDFGRSVDLLSVKESSSPLLFTGKIVSEDMEPISMREGKPWAADVDTFGLCASSHVLLFGCHIEVEYDHQRNRWHLKNTIRRYWRQELWCNMFDTLLNLPPGERHSNKLGEIRKDFESYLGKANVMNDVRVLLKGQIGYFPKK